MILKEELLRYLDHFLKLSEYQDYAPNGLQVEGTPQITTLVTGVTASQALIKAAIDLDADAILVHHGYFWKNEPPQITGVKYRRIKSLMMNDINLLGYHLPLDGHAQLGNNAMLGKLWQLEDITPEPGLVRLGKLQQPLDIQQFVDLVSQSLNRPALHLPGGPQQVSTIAWCSGGAEGTIDKALAWKADVYISGEVSEQTTHLALEGGIQYFTAVL